MARALHPGELRRRHDAAVFSPEELRRRNEARIKGLVGKALKKTKKRKRRERCDDCHELFDRSDLLHGSDPYAADLYGQENPCVLCVKCYNDRVAEI